MQTKKLLIITLLIIIGFILFLKLRPNEGISTDSVSPKTTEKSSTPSYLLPQYPANRVPLFSMDLVSSSKYFVSTNPQNISPFGDHEYSYYNVVFKTTASQQEFLDYYNGIFENKITEEYPNSSQVKGTIGDYRIVASHYDSDNYGYLQVYLPSIDPTLTTAFFANTPLTIKLDPELPLHEQSYGLLNQSGGQQEYTSYYPINPDHYQDYLSKLTSSYEHESNFKIDDKTSTLNWEKDGAKHTVVVSKDHSRIYVNSRLPITK